MQSKHSVKIAYLSCSIPQHEGQSLNLVCITPNCQKRRLLCSLCRQEHISHSVVPLKFLLSNLKNRLTSPPDDLQYCDKLEQLQNLKSTMLFQLKVCVLNLSEQFQRLQQEVIDGFNKVKMQIIEHIELGLQLDDIIASTIEGPNDLEKYKDDFEKLARWVREQNKELLLKLDFDSLIQPYKQSQYDLKHKLLKIQQFMEIQQKTIIKEPGANKPSMPLISQNGKIKYRFSSINKAGSIELSNNNLQAKQTKTCASRFVLIDEGVGLKDQKIVFRVPALKNWVGLGVCLQDKITSIGFAFKYENLGHGSYLLSNNGYTWSHSNSEDNIHSCLFTFKEGSIIEVTLSANQIVFKVRDAPAVYKLKINFKEEEWPKVCFCANLCSENDSIEILDE